VIVYCSATVRSAMAAKTMQDLGYTDVTAMAGGFGAWKELGYAIKVNQSLRPEQMARYSRHTLLPEVGMAGQLKLLEAKVLLIGAGGLGSPAGLYLAAAGVGQIGIVDFDVVDASNLQRQVLHTTDRVGMPKVESAAIAIRQINPDVKVVQYNTRLDSSNVFEIIGPYDIIVDGSDNFPLRYLLNDAAVFTGKTVVHGSIFRFDGQVTVLDTKHGGPCYRCDFPEPPDPDSDMAPNCAEAGVLGGHRDRQADPGDRGAAGGQQAGVRCPGHDLPQVQGPQGSQLPGLLGAPYDHRTDRLRGVLRHALGVAQWPRRDGGNPLSATHCRPRPSGRRGL